MRGKLARPVRAGGRRKRTPPRAPRRRPTGTPLGAWCANTAESLAMLLRPGNAGSNTVTDHIRVLGEAIAQLPVTYRRKILVRVDGAGATHDLVEHLEQMNRLWRSVRFTVGWTITDADETAIAALPADAWTDSLQPGQHRHRPGAGRRTDRPQPAGRQLDRRATADRAAHQAVGPAREEPHRPGETHRLAVRHRRHQHPPHPWRARLAPAAMARRAAPLTRRSGRSSPHGKAMGLRNLPSQAWIVNQGWVLAANIAADLAAWTRLLGLHDQPDLAHAEPATLRYRLLHLPAKLATHARRRILSIPDTWPWAEAFSSAGNASTCYP